MNNIEIYTIEDSLKKLDEFSEFNDFKGAYSYYKNLKDYLEKSGLKEADKVLYGKYYSILIRLKFIALNFFDDWGDVKNLIKNHFKDIYEIKYYNIWDKIKIHLISTSDLGKRDEMKSELRKSLLESKVIIINKNNYKQSLNLPLTIANWLKDYNANLGLKDVDNLKKIQYLTNSENIKKLRKEDKNKVRILFDFYERLKLSSNTPSGFEDEIPMIVNDKNSIFKGGKTEEISVNIKNLIKSIKTGEESEEEKSLEELKKMGEQYPVGSLERKVVEEEISKLESL